MIWKWMFLILEQEPQLKQKMVVKISVLIVLFRLPEAESEAAVLWRLQRIFLFCLVKHLPGFPICNVCDRTGIDDIDICFLLKRDNLIPCLFQDTRSKSTSNLVKSFTKDLTLSIEFREILTVFMKMSSLQMIKNMDAGSLLCLMF